MSGVLNALTGFGGLGGTVGTPDLNPTDTQFTAPATAVLSLTNAGAYTITGEAGGNYCTPTSLASQLEARLTLSSGTAPAGAAMNTWLNLGTTRTWSLTAFTGLGLTQGVCTLEIREVIGGTIRDTSTITFSAYSEVI